MNGQNGAPTPIPLTLVTGPLGAGKSRLINRVTALPAFAASVALANEAGTTPLCSPISPGDLPDLADGCLCCTAQGMLARVLEDLLRKKDNHRIAPFDRLIIETSGDADPATMAGEVLSHPYLSKRYALTGILAVGETISSQQQAVAARRVSPQELALMAAPDALFALRFSPTAWPEDARRALYRLRLPSRRP